MKLFKNKHCPRCNMKMDKNIIICPGCGLNFNKFNSATNKEAKVALKQGEKDRVLMRKGVPSDVSRVKLTLLTVLIGFTGAHYYYVGRNMKGMFFTIFFLVGLLNSIILNIYNSEPSGALWDIFTVFVIIWAIVVALWLCDIVSVVFNTFKIPVSLPY